MEEILSSIRRIIAEDEADGGLRGAAGGGCGGRHEPDDEDDDVLELTEVVGEPEPVADARQGDGAPHRPARPANPFPSPTCWRARRCPLRPSNR